MEGDEQFVAALDHIAFLARSKNRIRILNTLVEEPYTRSELQLKTGISRATVGRIVSDLEKRRLVIREGQYYRATSFGSYFAMEFTSLLQTAWGMQKVQPIIQWLPIDHMNFSFEYFIDAEITRASPSDSMAPIRRLLEIYRYSNHLRILVTSYSRESLREIWQAVLQNDLAIELIVTSEIVEQLMVDQEATQWAKEILYSEHGSAFCYHGKLPCLLIRTDEEVIFGLHDDDEALRGLLETESRAIQIWADSVIDSYRDAAEPFDPNRGL